MTTSTLKLIDEEILRTGGNLSKVARAMGLSYFGVRDHYMKSLLNRKTGCHPAVGPEPANITTLGRPGFEANVIAVKKQGGHWEDKYTDIIEDARRKFDAGTHEMFQTVDNGWVVQYLIPRMKPAPRRRFFASMNEVLA